MMKIFLGWLFAWRRGCRQAIQKLKKIDTDPNPIDSHSFALKPHPKAVGRQGEAFTDKIVLNLDAMEVQDMDSRVYSEVMGRWRRDAIHDLYEKTFGSIQPLYFGSIQSISTKVMVHLRRSSSHSTCQVCGFSSLDSLAIVQFCIQEIQEQPKNFFNFQISQVRTQRACCLKVQWLQYSPMQRTNLYYEYIYNIELG